MTFYTVFHLITVLVRNGFLNIIWFAFTHSFLGWAFFSNDLVRFFFFCYLRFAHQSATVQHTFHCIFMQYYYYPALSPHSEFNSLHQHVLTLANNVCTGEVSTGGSSSPTGIIGGTIAAIIFVIASCVVISCVYYWLRISKQSNCYNIPRTSVTDPTSTVKVAATTNEMLSNQPEPAATIYHCLPSTFISQPVSTTRIPTRRLPAPRIPPTSIFTSRIQTSSMRILSKIIISIPHKYYYYSLLGM